MRGRLSRRLCFWQCFRTPAVRGAAESCLMLRGSSRVEMALHSGGCGLAAQSRGAVVCSQLPPEFWTLE